MTRPPSVDCNDPLLAQEVEGSRSCLFRAGTRAACSKSVCVGADGFQSALPGQVGGRALHAWLQPHRHVLWTLVCYQNPALMHCTELSGGLKKPSADKALPWLYCVKPCGTSKASDLPLLQPIVSRRATELLLMSAGYMIVSMLMRKGMSLGGALSTFKQHRPAGIYKDEYIRALYEYYHEPLCVPIFPQSLY